MSTRGFSHTCYGIQLTKEQCKKYIDNDYYFCSDDKELDENLELFWLGPTRQPAEAILFVTESSQTYCSVIDGANAKKLLLLNIRENWKNLLEQFCKMENINPSNIDWYLCCHVTNPND